jgi:hypothetical protein
MLNAFTVGKNYIRLRDIYVNDNKVNKLEKNCDRPGNNKGGSITVPLTSCLTGLESAV